MLHACEGWCAMLHACRGWCTMLHACRGWCAMLHACGGWCTTLHVCGGPFARRCMHWEGTHQGRVALACEQGSSVHHRKTLPRAAAAACIRRACMRQRGASARLRGAVAIPPSAACCCCCSHQESVLLLASGAARIRSCLHQELLASGCCCSHQESVQWGQRGASARLRGAVAIPPSAPPPSAVEAMGQFPYTHTHKHTRTHAHTRVHARMCPSRFAFGAAGAEGRGVRQGQSVVHLRPQHHQPRGRPRVSRRGGPEQPFSGGQGHADSVRQRAGRGGSTGRC